jgi:hypothetical protein
MTDRKQRLRALDRLDTPDVWDRARSLDPVGELDGSSALPTRKRIVVIAVAFTVFAAAAAFAWRGFGGTRVPAAPPDEIAISVVWPERTLSSLMEAQRSADAGVPGTAWRLDPAKVAARFVHHVMGWGTAEMDSASVQQMGAPTDGKVEVWVSPYVVCPHAFPGGHCPPPLEDEYLEMSQKATVGPGGIWSVTSVFALDWQQLHLRPGQEVRRGDVVEGPILFPDLATQIDGFYGATGLHVGTDADCTARQIGELTPGDGPVLTISAPSQGSWPVGCPASVGGYVWLATSTTAQAGGAGAADPLGSSRTKRGTRLIFGLSMVPVDVLVSP